MICSSATGPGGVLVGVNAKGSGIAAGEDIGGDNTHSNTALVFSDYMLIPSFNGVNMQGPNASLGLGDNISHEAGHTFGLEHLYDTTSPRTVLVQNSEIMGYGLSWTQYGFFTRYPLTTEANPGVDFNVDYDRLIGTALLGPKPNSPAYVTGTGIDDTITIASSGVNSALVSVEAFSDAAHTTPIAVPGGNRTFFGTEPVNPTIYTASGNVFSYTIDTSHGIVIDGGEQTNWFTIDASLATSVTLRGGQPGANHLSIVGGGAADAYYYPSADPVDTLVQRIPIDSAAPVNLGGTLVVGPTSINFQDFASTGQIALDSVSNVTVNAPGGNDLLTVNSPAVGQTQVVGSSSGVAMVPLLLTNVGDLIINTGAGDDHLTVDSTNRLIAVPIFFNAGTGLNGMTLSGGIATSDAYGVGPDNGSGTSVISDGVITQAVIFSGLSPVLDLVAGPLTVNGTAADNAINYTQGSVATNGLVTIDNFESIEFSNKTTLTLNGGAGSDTINVNNPTIPTGLTGITVNGGDPTGSDQLIVNAQPGVFDPMVLEPTAVGAGTVNYFNGNLPNVAFTGVEHLSLVGQLSDGDPFGVDGTIGNDQLEYFPSVTPDTGTLTGTMDQNNATGKGPFALVPVTFSGMGQASLLRFNDFSQIGGTDSFVYHGTAADDTIGVGSTGPGGIAITNTVNGLLSVNLNANHLASATVMGGDGDDTFNVAGSVNIPLTVEGGDPSGSDVLNLAGRVGVAESLGITPNAVDNTHQDITGLGAAVTASGIELITYTGVGDDDTVSVNPGPLDNTMRVSGSSGGDTDRVESDSLPLIEYSAVHTFVANVAFGGTDTVTFATGGLLSTRSYVFAPDVGDLLIIEGSNAISGTGDNIHVSRPPIAARW